MDERKRMIGRLWTWLGPPAVMVALAVVVLAGLYRLPHFSLRDADTWKISGAGLYRPEHFGGLSYVYTGGDGVLEFPQAGAGLFAVTLRVGGPGAARPMWTHAAISGTPVDLGPLQQLRHVHLLAPAARDGSVRVALESPAVASDGDIRPVGVLLDWIALRSLRPVAPAPALLAWTAGTILLLWIALVPLALPPWRKAAALGVLAGAICGSLAALRGTFDLGPWWLAGGLLAVAGMGLARVTEGPLARPLRTIVVTAILWRVLLWIVALAGVWHSPAVHRYGPELSNSLTAIFMLEHSPNGYAALLYEALVRAWTRWDGRHYLEIAREGYNSLDARWPNIAFFPLYPLLVRGLLPIVHDHAPLAGLVVSHIALIAALLLMYDLLAADFGSAVAFRSLVLLLIFPTAFFLGAIYTEPVAILLEVAALWAIRRQRWWLAGLAGCLLALTRPPGVLIAPVIGLAYLQAQGWRWRAIRWPALAALLPAAGLALFMLYQWRRFNTPFAFMIAQQSWENPLAPPWVMPGTMLKAYRGPSDWEEALFQLAVWAAFIVLTTAALRRLPLAYGLTSAALLLPAYLATQPMSIVRHVLIAVPAFVMLALALRHDWLRWAVMSSMLALLTIMMLMYVNGFWIA